MKNIFILLILLTLSLFAYDDYDMDGVEDKNDKCPNSLITDLVDVNGCTTKALVSPHHYDVIVGSSYSQVNYDTLEKTDTVSGTLQLDYYYKNISLQLATSYFNSDASSYSTKGMNDTFVAGYYAYKPSQNLSVRVGAGLLLPTYDSGLDNNNIDYVATANLSYAMKSFNIFGGYSYTFVNDDDIDTLDTYVKYQNVNSFYGGVGFYPTVKLYMSAAYNSGDSIYEGVQTIQSASLYAYYSFDAHWFSTLSYAYGLSDSASDHAASIRLGYYF